MIIDLHCHLTFTRCPIVAGERFSFEAGPAEGLASGDTVLPTAYDSCVSPRALGRLSWRVARWFMGLPHPDEDQPAAAPASTSEAHRSATADAGVGRYRSRSVVPGGLVPFAWPRLTPLDRVLAERYGEHLLADGPIDRFVLLAFDAVHDGDGRCRPLPRRRGDVGSDIYTSNSLIRALCRQHPRRFLFGASVHPYRPDAVACLEEVFAAGACLLKWIPLHHDIDATDPRTIAVLRKCAELRLPLLLHYGGEFSLTTHRPAYQDVRPLLEVLRRLRREGVEPTVIIAHAATPVFPWGDRRSHRALQEAWAGDLADAPLYADLAAMTAIPKVPFLRSLLRRPELHARLLFGTDFPVPAGVGAVRRNLGREYARLAGVASWPQRTAGAYRGMSFGEIVMHRAGELLPNVRYFEPRANS